ncbi:C-GCAxxG-C-C family protein [Lawsonibacter sp. LCP25S3_G6]|uniref:C-GCAxxG-C-C family protein n=1 Tax=unclassified Lawsonibacter TaxID=2617946 RepID=UPI003F9E1284
MEHMELARTLRANTEVHYNCCQSVLVTFAKEMGLTQEQAYALGTFFNSGMRHGSVCGALSGALMVLGMTGCAEKQASALLQQFQADHCATNCAELLRAAHDRGEERKPHCDALVYEMVTAVEAILAQRQ